MHKMKTGWSQQAQGQVLGAREPHSSPQLPSQPVRPTTGADTPVPMALEFKMWYGFHTTGPLHSHQPHPSPYTCWLPGLLMEGKLIVWGLKETETLFSDCDETFLFVCLFALLAEVWSYSWNKMWLPYAVKFPLGAWHDIKFGQRHYIKKKSPLPF